MTWRVRSYRLVHTAKGRFWEVHWEGSEAETTTGALGTNGRSTARSFSNDRNADAWVAEQIANKRKEGFVELTDVGETNAPVATDTSLLERIIANPADDDLRLVYADQLTAGGDPLGEFITVQIGLARAPDGPGSAVLKHRERELLERFRARWSLRGADFRFERGFAVELRVSYDDLLTLAPRLWAAAPLLERVHVNDQYAWRTTEALRALLAQPGAARLAELHLGHGARDIADALAAATNLTRLEALSLRQHGLVDEDLDALLAASHLARLRRIDLRGNQLAGALAALAKRPLTRLGFAANRLGRSSVHVLEKAAALEALEQLDLSHNGIGDGGLGVLGRAEHLGAVRSLSLGSVGATWRGLDALAAGPIARSVRELDVSGNEITAEGARRLLSGAFPSLTHLDLSEAMLGDAGLDALSGPGARSLVSLELRKNGITPAGAARLAKHGAALVQLQYLTVSGNPLGERGVALLKEALPRVQLVARKAALDPE